MLLQKKISLVLGLFLLQNFLFPQGAVIVVSASKIEEDIEDATEKVQVVTSEEIKESGAKNLVEAVKELPGIVVTGASAGNPTDSISMQGFDSEYVKILIDGVAVTGDIGGSSAAFQIPVEDINRIEIVQGASSALYGSDAMGGVINIITKKVKKTGDGEEDKKLSVSGNITEEFSSNIRNYTALTLNVAGEKVSGKASGSFDWTKGKKKKTSFDAMNEGSLEYYETPKKLMGFARGNIDYTGEKGKVGANAAWSKASQESNFSAQGFSKNQVMKYDTQNVSGGITGEIEATDSLLFSGFSSVKSFWLETDSSLLAGASSSSLITDSNFLDWEMEARGTWDANLHNSVLFGINSNLQTIDGDSFAQREKQLLLSVFAQDTISLLDETLSIVPGGRFDFSPKMGESDFKFQATPKLSVRWDAADNTILRFSYGMGFKTPTLKQKYWIFIHSYGSGEGNFILYGNPKLNPEKSQSVNLSLEQKIGKNIKFSFGGYFNYIRDLINSEITDSQSVPQKRTYANIDEAITFGGDASLSLKWERLSSKIGYAYTGAKQKIGDGFEDLTLRVPHRITFNINYMIPKIETKVALSAEWNSPRLYNVKENTHTPDYFMAGFLVEKSFMGEKLTVYGRIDNLLNNVHFIKGNCGENIGETQEDYFALKDGIIFSLGLRARF